MSVLRSAPIILPLPQMQIRSKDILVLPHVPRLYYTIGFDR